VDNNVFAKVSQLRPFQPFVRSWNNCVVGVGFICDSCSSRTYGRQFKLVLLVHLQRSWSVFFFKSYVFPFGGRYRSVWY